jgi:PAS domain S-box-containing protein
VTVGNNVAHIILLALPGAKTIEVNPALEEIMGDSRDELLSMKIEKRYAHREERQAILGELATAGGGISRQLHWEKGRQ